MNEPSVALEFEEALKRVLSLAAPLPAEELPIAAALQRVLVEDIVAECELPRFSYSAMDGYALATRDLAGAPPFKLGLSGESRAGAEPSELVAGTAMRISTGAALPAGADCVVMQEDVERNEHGVRLAQRPVPFENVRRAGEDLKRGAVAIARGTRLTPFHLGLLAALDRTHVRVTRRVRLALLATGDELRDPGRPTPNGFGIPESNSATIAALALDRARADVVVSLRARDDPAELRERLREARSATPDVIVTIGGASVGDHDHVKQTLTTEGAVLTIYKVKIKPGKPFGFGRLGSSLVLALPGNPVSAQLGFALFGLPLLRALSAAARPEPTRRLRELGSAIRQKTGRLGFLRATLEGERALPHAQQASGSSVSLAHADALVVVPADVEFVAEGASVEVLLLDEL